MKVELKTVLKPALALFAAAVLAACGTPGRAVAPNDGKKPVYSASNNDDLVKFSNSVPKGTSMEVLITEKKITVGLPMNIPGYSEQRNGVLVGFDVELSKIIAGELGIAGDKITVVTVAPDAIADAINTKKVNLVLASYAVQANTKETLGVAGPYLSAKQGVLTKANGGKVNSPTELGGKTLCVVTGITDASKITAAGAKVVTENSFDGCLAQLNNGSVDGVAGDRLTLKAIASAKPEFKVLDGSYATSDYGVIIQKDDKPFRNWLTSVIDAAGKDWRYGKAWDASLGSYGTMEPIPKTVRY